MSLEYNNSPYKLIPEEIRKFKNLVLVNTLLIAIEIKTIKFDI